MTEGIRKSVNRDRQSLSHAAHASSLCTREPWVGRVRRRALLHAFPYGRCCALSMPPLMVRGGVERSETEGIRR